MGLGPDNKLYVNVGAPCNICEPPETNGQVRRINLDGIGRLVDVQVMKDGSLLVSDDYAGAVYRVTYASAKTVRR